MTSTVQAISQSQSLAAIRNLISFAVSCITYSRGLCSDEDYEERDICGLKIKCMLPISTEASQISLWLRNGVFDALEKNYLKEMALCIYTDDLSELLESYCFGFAYNSDGTRAQMGLTQVTDVNGSQRKSEIISNDGSVTQVRRNRKVSKEVLMQMLIQMVDKVINVTGNLPPLLRDRVLTMRLTYYDEVTPPSYEPPFFRPASDRMVSLYHEEQKENVNFGSMDTGYHLFSMSIRHPLVAAMHRDRMNTCPTATETLRTATEPSAQAKKTNPSVLSSAAGRVSQEEAEDAVGAEDAKGKITCAKIHKLPTVEEIAAKKETLRSREIVVLLFTSFILTKAATVQHGRGRVTLAEVQRYIEEVCPLEIGMDVAISIIDKLVKEKILQEDYGSGASDQSHLGRLSGAAAGHDSNVVEDWTINASLSTKLVASLLQHDEVVHLFSTEMLKQLQQLQNSSSNNSAKNKSAAKGKSAALGTGSKKRCRNTAK